MENILELFKLATNRNKSIRRLDDGITFSVCFWINQNDELKKRNHQQQKQQQQHELQLR